MSADIATPMHDRDALMALADEMAAENDELINYYSDKLRALATPSPQADKARGEVDRIGELIRTQDNRITAHPVFVVEQKRHVATTEDHADGREWYDPGAVEVYDDAGKAERDAERAADGSRPVDWQLGFYMEVWEFVTACFTEQGCKDYLAANGHNLKEPRIYAYSAYRNAEWQAVRKHLSATPQPQGDVSLEAGVDAAVAATGHINLNSMTQCADSWLAVVDVLSEVSPNWSARKGTGRECAISAIRELATSQVSGGGEDLEAHARGLLDTSLRNLGLHADAYFVGCGGELDQNDKAAINAIVAALSATHTQARPKCRCHEGHGARDCTIHTQADFDTQDVMASARPDGGEAVARIRNLADELASKTDVFPAAANWAEEFRVQADILATRPAATAVVPPAAVRVDDSAMDPGIVRVGDWAIPTSSGGARIMDERAAYGWNACRAAMLAAAPAATKGRGVDEASVDWRAMYRFQTAMRYMDNNPKLSREQAHKMADEDVAGLNAANPSACELVVDEAMVECALDLMFQFDGSLRNAVFIAAGHSAACDAAERAWNSVYDVDIHGDGLKTDNREGAMKAALTAALQQRGDSRGGEG